MDFALPVYNIFQKYPLSVNNAWNVFREVQGAVDRTNSIAQKIANQGKDLKDKKIAIDHELIILKEAIKSWSTSQP